MVIIIVGYTNIIIIFKIRAAAVVVDVYIQIINNITIILLLSQSLVMV